MFYSGSDLARSFRVVRKNTLQIAQDIPEHKYGFRASPDTRTVAELLAHIVASVRWTYRVHAIERPSTMSFEDFGRYAAENAAFEKTLTTKAAIIQALETNRDEVAAWLDKIDEKTLAETITFPAGVEPPSKIGRAHV